MKFLHTADCHLDSQLRGLEQYEGCPADRIRESTRTAFSNMIDLALREEVAFVIIAGDLFDGQWTSQQTALWTAQQFRRLQKAGILVYLLRGNHDALAEHKQSVTWPENVHEFSVEAPQTFQLNELGVALHGRGFAEREAREDLAVDYPDALPGCFNIGVLHTSLTGNPAHAPYAPTSEQVLAGKGYDYWALGHVHTFQRVSDHPRIVYPGCLQGRHIRETGAKGCVIVSVEGGNIRETFHETDVLRWELVEVPLDDVESSFDLSVRAREVLDTVVRQHAPRLTAVRVRLTGATEMSIRLNTLAGEADALQEVRNVANQLDDLWIEKLEIATVPPLSLQRLQEDYGLLGELLRDISELQQGPEEELAVLTESLQPLAKRAAGELLESGIHFDDPEQIRQWLQRGESILRSLITQQLAEQHGRRE